MARIFIVLASLAGIFHTLAAPLHPRGAISPVCRTANTGAIIGIDRARKSLGAINTDNDIGNARILLEAQLALLDANNGTTQIALSDLGPKFAAPADTDARIVAGLQAAQAFLKTGALFDNATATAVQVANVSITAALVSAQQGLDNNCTATAAVDRSVLATSNGSSAALDGLESTSKSGDKSAGRRVYVPVMLSREGATWIKRIQAARDREDGAGGLRRGESSGRDRRGRYNEEDGGVGGGKQRQERNRERNERGDARMGRGPALRDRCVRSEAREAGRGKEGRGGGDAQAEEWGRRVTWKPEGSEDEERRRGIYKVERETRWTYGGGRNAAKTICHGHVRGG
ncbi:hypothetical protein DFH09DRAFT_1415046 [Mycena vulgaris]|nr:hypothetical protein DFH09DRAFT_1415046 [Mycena vulgaris]